MRERDSIVNKKSRLILDQKYYAPIENWYVYLKFKSPPRVLHTIQVVCLYLTFEFIALAIM